MRIKNCARPQKVLNREPSICPYHPISLFAMTLRGSKHAKYPLKFVHTIYNVIKKELDNYDYEYDYETYGTSFINIGVFSENTQIMDFLLSRQK